MRIRRQVIVFAAAELVAEGRPQRRSPGGGQITLDGRPIARWSRIEAGRNDGPRTAPGEHSERRCP